MRWRIDLGLLHAILLLLVALILLGCGGLSGTEAVGTAPEGDKPDQQELVAMLTFAPPSELLKSVSFDDADRFCWGAGYAQELPANGVSAAGSEGWFSPSWQPTTSASPDDLAYAMYVFSLEGFTGPPELMSGWVWPPADRSCCFLGLGNQARGCWDWFSPPDGSVLTLASLNPYLDGEGNLLLTVAVTGTDVCALSWLCWGGNIAPTAQLTVDPSSGGLPLEASFDASGSTDLDGVIADYEWDLDGDGEYGEVGDEADAAGSATASFTYVDTGEYIAAVRVTDNDGAQDTATQQITVYEPGWVIVTVDDPETGSTGTYTSLAVVDGCPAISYCSRAPGQISELRYARATTATGVSEADWGQIVTADTDEMQYGYMTTTLVVADGNPAIAYQHADTGTIRYARAATSTGANAADWSSITAVPYGDEPTLAIVDGNPAIAFRLIMETALMYVRATTSSGADAADWGEAVEVDNSC